MLVADDDELVCKTAINTLKSMGIKAEWTLSGEKAIELVIQHHKKERGLSNHPIRLEITWYEWDSGCKGNPA